MENKCKKQTGCLRRPYKQLWKEEKQKAKEKSKDIPIWIIFHAILIISNTPKIRMLLRHANSYAKVYAFKTSINIIQKKKKNRAFFSSLHLQCLVFLYEEKGQREGWLVAPWEPGTAGVAGLGSMEVKAGKSSSLLWSLYKKGTQMGQQVPAP